MLSALAKVHAQARLPLGEGFEQLLHDAASSHNTDLQLRAVQIQSMFECVSSSSALPYLSKFTQARSVKPYRA